MGRKVRTLIGGLEYIVQSNDNANIVPPKDRFKFIDDLSILQLILLSGLVGDYNFHQHVASDISVGQKFLPPNTFNTQEHLNFITNWTHENKMKLNPSKCKFMIFSRSKENFTTRLQIDNEFIERVPVMEILGTWISEDLTWTKNCQEICKKAYSRLSIITKLKYVGVGLEDLIDIYVKFIRSITEYCAVSFHSSLTQEQSNKLEKIQKTCLRVILGDMYTDYNSALLMCGLETLSDRRNKRCLEFSLKSLKHPRNSRLFPRNPVKSGHRKQTHENFKVNFASTSA